MNEFGQVKLFVTSLTQVTVTELQVSEAVTLVMSGTGTSAAQLTVTGPGQEMLGLAVSTVQV